MWLTSLTNQLATLGDPEADDKVVAKYLCVARPRYRQLVVSIETMLDISTLLVEEVTARLKAVEADGVVVANQDGGDKLYLIEEEWLEHFKQKESEGGHRSGGSRGGGSGGGGSGSRGKKTSGKKVRNGSESSGMWQDWPLGQGVSQLAQAR
jgi:uncharacterized membrane protein YgcG